MYCMHSTQTCLLNVSDYLLENINSGYFTGAVFLDFKKAFDTVHHERLLDKLNNIGVRGLEFDWFISYLHGRQQVTKISDKVLIPALGWALECRRDLYWGHLFLHCTSMISLIVIFYHIHVTLRCIYMLTTQLFLLVPNLLMISTEHTGIWSKFINGFRRMF